MSGNVKMFHIAPTTFHGISIGSAIVTRQNGTQGPLRGMASAIAIPSGTSMIRIRNVNRNWRPRALWKRSDFSTCANQSSPCQKNRLSPKVS